MSSTFNDYKQGFLASLAENNDPLNSTLRTGIETQVDTMKLGLYDEYELRLQKKQAERLEHLRLPEEKQDVDYVKHLNEQIAKLRQAQNKKI